MARPKKITTLEVERNNPTGTDHLKVYDLEDNIRGMPSLALDSMLGSTLPGDWKFKSLFGDIIMVQYADENVDGILRDGIYVQQDITRSMWRVGKVVMAGPSVKWVNVGDLVCFPSDRGIPMVDFNKTKYIFLNVERIFGVVEPAVRSTSKN